VVAPEHLGELRGLPVAHSGRHVLYSEPSSRSCAARAIRTRCSSRLKLVPPTSLKARWSCRREVAISCATLARERSSSR
jgi:hypothetical protein